jgi:mRNA interferase MazF
MQKDFDRWNKLKKTLNALDEPDRLYFHEGDVWWARLGANVGFEIDGKHRDFSRPVIVLRKYNQYSFLALPLTTAGRPNRWRIAIGKVAGKQAFAVLSQLRNLDSARLYQKIVHIEPDLLVSIREAASRMNFG